MQTRHIVVKGKVQGVFYRATAAEQAINFGLTGWVRNVPNGDVEILVSGVESMLDQFETWCKQGPELANVTNVESSIVEFQKFDQFIIRQ